MTPRAADAPSAHLQQALELTRAMREACAAEHWERLPGLAAQRRQLLEQAFADAVTGEEAERVAACIRRMQQWDAEILQRCEAHRAHCSNELKRLQEGRKAVTAYRRWDTGQNQWGKSMGSE